MRIEIRHTNLDVSDALKSHVQHKVALALRRFRDRIADVAVRIVDENGPRGGIDKRCRIVVESAGGRQIVVQGNAADAYDAVTYAATRLDVQVKRAGARGLLG
jgi:putative sigma-54 modulation protein